MEHNNSQSASYAAAGVDITAGYKAVELMKTHIARTRNLGCLDDVGGFGGCFGLPIAGMEEPVLVSGTDGCGTKVKLAILMDKHDTIGIDCRGHVRQRHHLRGRKASVFPGLHRLRQKRAGKNCRNRGRRGGGLRPVRRGAHRRRDRRARPA